MTGSSAGPDTATKQDYRDEDLRAVVARLSRKHPSGGTVIERAAILAEGRDANDVVAWVVAHGGEAESAGATPARGLHGARIDAQAASTRVPLRYVLPAGALVSATAEPAPIS